MNKTPPTQSVPSTETGHASDKWTYVFGNSSGTSVVIFEGKKRIAEVHYLEDAKKLCTAHNDSLRSFDSASPWVKTADTERLDWLENKFDYVEKIGQDENGDTYRAEISFRYPQITADGSENLREAIDAARNLSADVTKTNAGGVSNPKSSLPIPPVPQQHK